MTDTRLPDDAMLAVLLDPPPAPEASDVPAWWRGELARRKARPGASPFELAVAGGLDADRLGWALASGYQASLLAMIPDLPTDVPVAFCISEADGNSPRAIRSSLTPDGDGFRLSGEKRWSTLGPAAGLLLVAAREPVPPEAARPSIRLVRVAAGAPGLEFIPMPEADFTPEVPHARTRLDGVRIEPDAIMPDDAYDQFVKPFRTIEDVLVTAGKLAYLLAEAGRRDWPLAWRERAVAALVGLGALAGCDRQAGTTHIALSGALSVWRELATEATAYFAEGPADAAARRWARDSRLFEIGFSVRALRTERAWQRVSGGRVGTKMGKMGPTKTKMGSDTII